MAASIPIEEHSGTFSGHRRAHNGYHAGDFSAVRFDKLSNQQPQGPSHSSHLGSQPSWHVTSSRS